MVMNISCTLEKFTYNTLASREVPRTSLHTVAASYLCVIIVSTSDKDGKPDSWFLFDL